MVDALVIDRSNGPPTIEAHKASVVEGLLPHSSEFKFPICDYLVRVDRMRKHNGIYRERSPFIREDRLTAHCAYAFG